jgi:hypothetical protein
VLDEIEKRRFRPLQIVEIDDERLLRGFLLQELPERELRLRRGAADDALRLVAELQQHFNDRPVRDALAVVQAAAAQHPGPVSDRVDERAHEP